MFFKEGATVYTADHEKAGTIDRVVFDPHTKEVTHLVILKGFLFTEQKLVPIDLIESVLDDNVFLRTPSGLLDLPDFEETYFLTLADDELQPDDRTTVTRPVFWYPPIGRAWWGNPAAPHLDHPDLPYTTKTEQNIPEGTVAMKEGAKVITADGEHVGDVERVFIDLNSDRATHFIISQGLLLKERKVVPTLWVRKVGEDQVQLTVTSSFINQLPEYEEA